NPVVPYFPIAMKGGAERMRNIVLFNESMHWETVLERARENLDIAEIHNSHYKCLEEIRKLEARGEVDPKAFEKAAKLSHAEFYDVVLPGVSVFATKDKIKGDVKGQLLA